jgi:hypothetical protein
MVNGFLVPGYEAMQPQGQKKATAAAVAKKRK